MSRLNREQERMLRSQEAQTVASTTREIKILSDALQALAVDISNASGTTKKQLRIQEAELKVQQRLNEAKRSEATTRFRNKFNSSMPIMDISNGAEAAEAQAKVDEENNKKFAKKISLFGQGVDLFIDAASKLASISYDTEFEKIAARADLLMFDIDALSQKSIMAADMVSKAYVSAVTNSITSITDGINAGAYSSASDIIDLSAQKKIFDLEQQRIDLENKNSRNLRVAQRDAKFSDLYAQQTQAEVTAGAEFLRIGANAANDVEASFLGFGGSLGDAPGAVGDIVAGIAKGGAAALSTMIQSENKLIVQRFENEKKVSEAVLKSNQEVEKKWIESGANVAKAWLQFAQKIEDGLIKSEAASNDMGISLGFNNTGGQLEAFKSDMYLNQMAVSRWGKKMEDMQKVMNSYNDNTGRGIQLEQADFSSTFALDLLTGQDGLSNSLTEYMETQVSDLGFEIEIIA